MTTEQFGIIYAGIEEKLGNDTRAGVLNVSEQEIEEMLQPCVVAGKQIQEQLLKEASHIDGISQHDIELVKDMDALQLATLDYVIQVVDAKGNGNWTQDPETRISWSQVTACLTTLAGVNEISSILAQEYVSWRTAWQIAKAVVKRIGGGWITVGIILANFGACIYG